MKRILLLSSEFPPGPGGIGTHAYHISRALEIAGWDVQVISPQDYADHERIISFNNFQPFNIERLPFHRNKLLQTINRLWIISRILREFKPDIVVASGTRAIWISALLLIWRKIPWVLIGHGTEFGKRRGLSAYVTRLAGNRATYAICVSQFTQEAMRKLGIRKLKSTVINNGADNSRFYPIPNNQIAAFRINHSVSAAFVLLTVGNVSDRKGQEVVIRALPLVKQVYPNVYYWMAGLPTKQVELEKLAVHLGVSDSIRFWGCVSHNTLLNLYNACDLFVMTSRQLTDGDFEGYGIAVIEAALCGKTALVSSNSGLAEAVQDGVTGLVVAQDSVEETAQGIIRLARSNQLLTELSSNAQARAIKESTWDHVSKRYIELFESLVT